MDSTSSFLIMVSEPVRSRNCFDYEVLWLISIWWLAQIRVRSIWGFFFFSLRASASS
ncbi:hypothetical protein RchiOBHm_Chr1g0347761 [Rosa chinensis]|uniref:Uncharacterized protein n=1 Tax=Rosa chinensis TaxID=74649 RepID=A0A2P6SFD7_ROSCH|nr:hypothetical protein RchiOBHm_Chr1g0347761 [Rosa chinensis]